MPYLTNQPTNQPANRQADWLRILGAEKSGDVLEVEVKSYNTGGVVVAVGSIRGEWAGAAGGVGCTGA